MSNENITPEIQEFADDCRKIAIGFFSELVSKGEYDAKKFDSIAVWLSRYRLCLEIMKLEREL